MNHLDEHEEAWAARLIANGAGSWPLQHPLYDEACVSFPLESVDDVQIYLRRRGQTLKEYKYCIKPRFSQASGSLLVRVPDDYANARAWFRGARLAMPRVPSDLRKRFIRLEDGVFTTRPICQSPYDLERFMKEAAAGIVHEYAVLAYHGPSSAERKLHYYLRHGALTLFLQLSWDAEASEAAIRSNIIGHCFRLADNLHGSVEAARHSGRLGPRDELRVVGSDLRGSSWSAAAQPNCSEEALDPSLDPAEVLTAALAWVTSLPKGGRT